MFLNFRLQHHSGEGTAQLKKGRISQKTPSFKEDETHLEDDNQSLDSYSSNDNDLDTEESASVVRQLNPEDYETVKDIRNDLQRERKKIFPNILSMIARLRHWLFDELHKEKVTDAMTLFSRHDDDYLSMKFAFPGQKYNKSIAQEQHVAHFTSVKTETLLISMIAHPDDYASASDFLALSGSHKDNASFLYELQFRLRRILKEFPNESEFITMWACMQVNQFWSLLNHDKFEPNTYEIEAGDTSMFLVINGTGVSVPSTSERDSCIRLLNELVDLMRKSLDLELGIKDIVTLRNLIPLNLPHTPKGSKKSAELNFNRDLKQIVLFLIAPGNTLRCALERFVLFLGVHHFATMSVLFGVTQKLIDALSKEENVAKENLLAAAELSLNIARETLIADHAKKRIGMEHSLWLKLSEHRKEQEKKKTERAILMSRKEKEVDELKNNKEVLNYQKRKLSERNHFASVNHPFLLAKNGISIQVNPKDEVFNCSLSAAFSTRRLLYHSLSNGEYISSGADETWNDIGDKSALNKDSVVEFGAKDSSNTLSLSKDEISFLDMSGCDKLLILSKQRELSNIAKNKHEQDLYKRMIFKRDSARLGKEEWLKENPEV